MKKRKWRAWDWQLDEFMNGVLDRWNEGTTYDWMSKRWKGHATGWHTSLTTQRSTYYTDERSANYTPHYQGSIIKILRIQLRRLPAARYDVIITPAYRFLKIWYFRFCWLFRRSLIKFNWLVPSGWYHHLITSFPRQSELSTNWYNLFLSEIKKALISCIRNS